MENYLNKELVKEIRNGDVVFFVGAGISMDPPSNLPNANEIIKALVTWCSFPSQKEEMYINNLKKFHLELIIGDMSNEVQESILALLKSEKPNDLHHFLAEALMLGNTVLTTNFDYLIESACNNLKFIPEISIPFQPQIFKKPKSWDGSVIKVHGALDSKNIQNSAIIDFRMFGELPHLPVETAECLDELSQRKRFVFLGYSGSDDFDLMPKLLLMQYKYPPIWLQHTNELILNLVSKESLDLNCKHDLLINSKSGIKLFGNTRRFLDNIAVHHKDVFSRVPIVKKKKRNVKCELEITSKLHSIGGIRDTVRAKLCLICGNVEEAFTWLNQCRFDLFYDDYDGHIENYNLMMGILLHHGMYDEAQSILGSAEKLYKESPNRVSAFTTAELNLKAANIYIQLKQYDRAKSYLEKMKKKAPEIENNEDRKLFEGRFYSLTAAIEIEESKFESAMQNLDKSYEILTCVDPEGAYRCFSDMGLTLFRAGLYDKALKYWELVLDYYEKVGRLVTYAKVKSNCGFAYAKIGQYDKAIPFLEDSSALLEKIFPNTGDLAAGYRRLAILYWNIKRSSQKSKEYINKTEKAASMHGDVGLVMWCEEALKSIENKKDIEEQGPYTFCV